MPDESKMPTVEEMATASDVLRRIHLARHSRLSDEGLATIERARNMLDIYVKMEQGGNLK